jgi:hypothetical protein
MLPLDESWACAQNGFTYWKSLAKTTASRGAGAVLARVIIQGIRDARLNVFFATMAENIVCIVRQIDTCKYTPFMETLVAHTAN